MSALIIDTKTCVRFITLNRPERHNAFDDGLIAELTQAFLAASADDGVRVVVLDSVGKSFSAGADLEWMKRMAGYDRARNLEDAKALARLMQVIDQCPKPTIAVVQGAAYGGGVGLAATCDMVVAADHALFCLSEVKLGIIPAVISPYVVRAIGARASRRYFQTAETFAATKAAELGLVSEVASPEQLIAVRDRWIAALLVNGPAAMAAAKDLAVQAAERTLDDSLRVWTAERIADLRASDEGKEGVTAFLERRKPSWIGG
ncbi:enoyl-CoA hydratase/isomerase family protein [Magnetospirillum moscoviense]|uniref:Enoyl-CoA hydratase n=1 Tax=Magnetospirillum moscoviense TaxID=1437059 RepID=A0A178MV74_9PROT|nr:enoyl-CoA hydratase/isomerase family protein [Magnetospirillum moscoviense]OAN53980.1 enoyl-CoA hydratase [Magnetospirillum moscoviense]